MKDQPICQIDGHGTKRWYLHGRFHREDGPATEYTNGDKFWYLYGQLHREDGPAIEHAGTKYWYLCGKKHRENGPAIEEANGDKEWWYHGQPINCQSNEEYFRLLKLKAFW
jgi:hypothetical protein